jgi:hypothetical protein
MATMSETRDTNPPNDVCVIGEQSD